MEKNEEYKHKDFANMIVNPLLAFVGEDPDREGLLKTPERYLKAMEFLTSGYSQKIEDVMTVFDNEGYDQMVLLKDIEFYSLCEHHILPFTGKAHVAYIPDKKIIGLSKLARVVDIYARRLQNQERMTQQIADAIWGALKPKGVAVFVEGAHMCMRMRGVQKQGGVMTTTALKGSFKEDAKARDEFYHAIGG